MIMFIDKKDGCTESRELLQRKRHIKIELCVALSVLRLFHVGHVLQKKRSVLSIDC